MKLFKPGYLIVVLIPVTFFFLNMQEKQEKEIDKTGHIYFSAKCNAVSTINVLCGNDTLIHRKAIPGVITLFEYVGLPVVPQTIRIVIEGMGKTDTFSLFSLNYFHQGKITTADLSVVSDRKRQFGLPTIIQNNHLIVTSDSNSSLQRLFFSGNNLWHEFHQPDNRKATIILSFATFLLLVMLVYFFQPSQSFLVGSLIIILGIMFLIKFLQKDLSINLVLKSDKQLEGVDFFYGHDPKFSADKEIRFDEKSVRYCTEVNIKKYPFLRCDPNAKTGQNLKLQLLIESGFLKKKISPGTVQPYELLLNDQDIDRNGNIIIKGSDPYWVLSGGKTVRDILLLKEYHDLLFLIVPVILILLFLVSGHLYPYHLLHRQLLAYGFLSLIFTVYLIFPFHSTKLIMEAEKRKANQMPVFTWSGVNRFFPQLNCFLDDQFPGRLRIISNHNWMEYSLFNVIVSNEPLVHFGKNGWMYYMGDNVKEMYQNKHPLTPGELKKIKDQLEKHRDWLKSKNIRYYIFFPNISNFAYEENLGRNLYRINSKSKIEQLLEYLKEHSSLDIIDVNTPIREAKRKYQRDLYYSVDSHWNLFGTYFAYKAIIDHIRKDFPTVPEPVPLKEIKWITTLNDAADLIQLISLTGYINRIEYIPLHSRIKEGPNLIPPDYPEYKSLQAMILKQNNDESLPRVVINRDSYSNYFMPYFSSHFSRTLYLWTPLFYSTIIEKEKPDIVILEMLDRFLYDLLIDDPVIK